MRPRKTTVWISLLILVLVLVAAGSFGIRKIERTHHELEVINKTHFVAVSMRQYVQEHGKFPESLESLAADLKLDARAVGPIHDDRIVYKQPAATDADSLVILTVTGNGFESVVTKGFERRTVKVPGRRWGRPMSSSVSPNWYHLRDALEEGDFSKASSLLGKNPGLIAERNGVGESILHFLAVENNQRAVEWLEARGSDLNAANKFGTPLLFEVAQLGYRDLFLWLIQHGADPKKKGAQGQRIDEYLADYEQTEMIEFIKQNIEL